MSRAYRGGRSAAVATVAVLAIAGCGLVGGGEKEPKREATQLRSAAAAVKEAVALRASFEVKQRVGTVIPGTLSGTADVVAGAGMAVTYTYISNTTIERNKPKADGTLLAVDEKAFIRSSQMKPPSGKKWISINPRTRAKLDVPIPPEWLALVMSRLLDPLFVLDQGMPDVKSLAGAPATVDGIATTKYTVNWNLELDGAGPEVTAWGAQIGNMVSMELTLHVGADGRPVKLEVDSATEVMLFDAAISFHDYGAKIAVDAPAPGDVAQA
jgi:hypothetical protein